MLDFFVTSKELDKHIESVHEGRKFKCEICLKNSKQVRNYMNMKSPLGKGGNSKHGVFGPMTNFCTIIL